MKNRDLGVSDISIHAPRGGSDSGFFDTLKFTDISIHAPRGGSDLRRVQLNERPINFNPRSPWGERHY